MKTICSILNSNSFILLSNMMLIQSIMGARQIGSTIENEFCKRYPEIVPVTNYLISINPYVVSGFIKAMHYAHYAAEGNSEARKEYMKAIVKFHDSPWLAEELNQIKIDGERYYEKIQSILTFFITQCSAFKFEASGNNPDFKFQRQGLSIGLELVRKANL